MLKTGICFLFLTMLGGCASEKLYEGLRLREATRDPIQQSASSRLSSYQDYEAERKKLLERK